MHLRCLPRALVAVLLVPPVISSRQYPLQTASSTTLVDVLSADSNYTSLLHLLQRARLIPTLNKLNNVTLFAPTNDAIKHNNYWDRALNDGSHVLSDNVQEQLRQQLLYHLLNHKLLKLPTTQDPQTYNTFHFPTLRPPQEPPPSPPWIPTPGGSLGGSPQRIRIVGDGKSARVGVDAFGKGDSNISNASLAGNGVVYSLSKILEAPADLAHAVSQQQSISYFSRILTPEITDLLNSTSELTLFVPIDSSWEALDPYERLYLESGYASDDMKLIFNMHAVVEKGVRYSDTFAKSTTLKTLDGSAIEINVSGKNITVSAAKMVQPDIYASNGVLHLVDSLLMPPGTLQLTPEKYLLALNCTSFVSLLHSVNLTSLVNDTETEYTILAPPDDVMSFAGTDIPEKGSLGLKNLLQYHFLLGKWTPQKLANGMLLETALEEVGLAGHKQVLSVEVTSDDKKPKPKSIRFAGAGIIGNPIDANGTLIYFLSRPLVTPVDPLQASLPYLDLSSFLAAVFSTSQAETLRNTPQTTLLIPRNSAFERLGMLVSAHLLAASSKDDLEKVLLHHALSTVEYGLSLRNGSQHSFATLEGSDLNLQRQENGVLITSPSGGWTGMRSELFVQDRLSMTGVVHELSDILIPRSVNLTIGKLVKAAQCSTMASMAVKAGFEWVLNGTAPPEESTWANQDLSSAGWTLLCPMDSAFKDMNLTKLYSDVGGLQAIVSQHLVPPTASLRSLFSQDVLYNNRPLPFEISPTYSTLLSTTSAYGDLIFRLQDPKGKEYVVGVDGARGTYTNKDWARILSWGRSTAAGGGGVIQIDRLLRPYNPPWWTLYSVPGGVAVGLCALICLFFYGVRIVWRRDTTEATFEPVGGFGPDDEP